MINEMVSRAIQSCACANIRRVDRVITQFYDEILAPSKLHVTQFLLLANIARSAPVSINQLADLMEMDRTTLTRNLALLNSQQLVRVEQGKDRRVRQVLLTQEGEQAFWLALPLWQRAQAQVEQSLGSQRFDALLTELSAVIASTRSH